MNQLAKKTKSVLSPELSNYVHAYISAWLKEDSWPKTEDNKAKLTAIHDAWPFYVSRGFFETEEFYRLFLKKNGIGLFPAFLRLMDNLQKSRKSIFITDGNPRQVPFPPAFQAGFFQLMKSAIVSGDDEELQSWISSLAAMKELGMSRLHRSARQGDYHIMPIEQWLHFLKSISREDKASWNNDLMEAEGLELIKTWVGINRDWLEHTTNMYWPFSPETEEERLSEPTSNGWYYTFRDGFSKESWMRCLEITGAEHLCSVLHLGYVKSPTKFHYSLGHGNPDDVFLQPAFEEAIESFIFSPKKARHDVKEQAGFIGKALLYLKALGIKEFYDGFDVADWASRLADSPSVADTESDGKPDMKNEEMMKSQPSSWLSSLRLFLKDGWEAWQGETSSYLRCLMNMGDAYSNAVDELNVNHAPAPSGPVQAPGSGLYILALVAGACFVGANYQTSSNCQGLFAAGLALYLFAPLIWELVSKYARFCLFARWRRENWRKKNAAERKEGQKIKNEWGSWYRAMTGDSLDCNSVEIDQAIQQAEDLAYAWDWANPALMYYGDSKMFHEIYMGLFRTRNQILSKWQAKVPVRLFPRKPPTPAEEDISLVEILDRNENEIDEESSN